MTFTIHGSDDLGVVDCEYVASGETAGDAAQDMIEHLRSEHDVDMPDADVVTSDDDIEAPSSDAQVIIERLRDVLNVPGTVTTSDDELESDAAVPPGDMPGNL